MRVFVLSLFVGVSLGLPQGYEYQVHLGPSDNNEFTLDQFQLLQQFADQQQHQQQFQLPAEAQIAVIGDNAPEIAGLSQTVAQTEESGGYQFANQLGQQAQIEQFEQQQQQQQQQPQQHVSAGPESVHTSLLAPQLQGETNSQQYQKQEEQLSQQIIQQQQQQQVDQQLVAQSQLEQLPAQQQQQQQQQQLEQEPQQQEFAQPLVEAKHQQPQPQVPVYTAPAPPPPPAPVVAPAQPHYQPLQYNKEFYYLSAPQEDYDQTPELQSQLGKLKKNLRVVFIKAPEQNGLEKAALQLAQNTNSAQTAIYVLTKQHNVAELANKLQQVRASSHAKPEVVFVKYRTPAEADHAQRTIQAQFEALDGPNHFNHEGVVPSHDFIGSTDPVEPRKRPADEVSRPVSKYLPAAAVTAKL